MVYKDDPKDIATGLGNLAGRLAEREADWDEAAAAYARALKILEAVLDPGDPSLAITLSNFGDLHRRRKEFAEAVRLTERAAEIDKTAHGAESAHYATRLDNLSAIYR